MLKYCGLISPAVLMGLSIAGLGVGCLGVVGMATPAFAQDADKTDSAADTKDVVVVTAQKRSENVQRVPMAVSVVDVRQLERAGIRDFSGLTKAVPSLTLTASDQPVNASVIIRGVGTYAFSIAAEPSVAIQVDDIPLGFQARALSDLNDLERVEVLRGPQSTLYGQSASAGLINITTKDPSADTTIALNALATSDGEYRAGASLSGHLTESLGYRITGGYTDFKGNIKNVTLNRWVNGKTSGMLRGKLKWHPNENLTATLGLSYAETDSECCTAPFLRLAPNAPLRGNAALTPAITLPGVEPGYDNRNVNQDTLPLSNTTDFGQSLKIAYQLDNGLTLMSITGHGLFKQLDQTDNDRTAYAPLKNIQGGQFRAELTSQEFRLLSDPTSNLRYVGGLFYGKNDYLRSLVRGASFAQQDWVGTSLTENYAAFGQVDWDAMEKLTLIAGLRYLKQDTSYTFRDHRAGTYYSGDSSDDTVLGRLGFKYQHNANNMLYANYSKGYKGQAYDISSGFNAARAAVGPVEPETSNAYEIGIRSQLLDRKLTLNVTAFAVDYENFQAQGIDTIGGVLNFRLTNVGKVTTAGIEADFNARINERLRLNGGVSFINAEIKSYPKANCYPNQTVAAGCIAGSPSYQNLAGASLPNSPEVKFNLGFDGTIANFTNHELILSGTYNYQSKVHYALTTDPETVQDAYGLLNLSLSLNENSDKYKIALFVNNVFDEHYAAFIENRAGNFGNQLATEFMPGRDADRYAGIRLNYNF